MSDRKRIIVNYLNKGLGAPLHHFGTSDVGIRRTLEHVKFQMESLLHHWTDMEFRNAVFFPGIEEAEFYGPVSKMEARCFVVTTVRNSLFQLATKNTCNQLGMSKPLTDRQITLIMQEAVKFYDFIDLEDLGRELSAREIEKDIYLESASQYPVAFQAFKALGNSISRQVTYDPLSDQVVNFDQLSEHFGAESNLIFGIKSVLTGETPSLYMDSFKMLTRDFSNLLYLVETVLEHDKLVVTANYYISNGYCEKRKRLLKPAQSGDEARSHLENLKGLGERHRSILEQMQS